ncbi:DNA polymerase III subunit beta [Klebsiella pneumoniae]|uniref:nucleotidyltransferase family protein n=1 Tax=Klebsiella pneumoniae TaxID=573 RepID=UPI0009BAB7A1
MNKTKGCLIANFATVPLVDALPGATLLDLGDLEEELKSLLGVDVDLLTPGDLPPKFRAKVLAEAQPI